MGRPDYILGQFGSKVNLFVITGLRRLALTSQYHSLGGSRGRGLLCLAPQLVTVLELLSVSIIHMDYINHLFV